MKEPRSNRRTAESGADLTGEVRALRRTLRDLVALSTLPSIWVDYDLPRSIQNLTDVLRAALRAFTICVRVELPDGAVFKTAASNGLSNQVAHFCYTELLNGIDPNSTELVEVPRFNGSGPLNALPQPIFFNGRQIGCIIVCYRSDVVPSASDPLLLQVATSQIALLFQRHKDQEACLARRLAEERLRETEHHYQQLVQSLPAAVYTTDSQARITLYNEAAVKLWGRRPKIGQDLSCGSWRIFRPDGSPMPLEECPMAIAIREGRSVRGQEIIVERPDGSRAWVLPHPDPIRDQAGKIVGFVNMLVEIGELKRAEQAARANEARVQSLLTLMPAAVYVCDADGRITFYNRRAVELWGEEPKLNDNRQKFCAMHKCWFDGKQILPDETPMAVAVREGKAFRNLEPTIERPDGTRLSVLVNIDPIFDSSGRPAGAINVFQDVTPLKHAQEKLRSREEHLRAVVENTPECVKLVSGDGTLLGMNGAGLSMIEADSAEQVVGKNIYNVIAPEYREAFRAMNERVCAGNRDRLEFEIIGLKGTRRWMETYAAPIVDPALGRTVQLGVTRNITERRNAELELERKNKQLAAFLETAALGLHRVGPDGTILWANDAELQMLGYAREEYIGHDIREFHADDPVINDILKRLTCGEKLNGYEARLKCKDGSIKEVLIDSSVLWDEGKFLHTQCFTRDVTKQKRAERALAAKIRQQRAVSELGMHALREERLQVLFDRAVSEISRTLEVDYCKVLELLPGGDAVLLRAGVGWKEGLVGKATVSTGKDSQAGYTLASSQPVIVKDLRKETRFNGPPLLHDHNVVSGLSCIIGEPDRPWGVLGAHTRTHREFTEEDVAFIQAVANILATSIERKRAEAALLENKALLETQKDAFQAAMRGSSLEASLEILVRRAVEFTGGRGRAAFYVTSSDGRTLHHIIGMDEHYAKTIDGYPVSGESMACGLAVYTGEPVIARDVEQDPKWEPYRWLARQHHFRACWSFPVRTKDGPVLGTFAMYFPEPCEPTAREMNLASVMAHAAVVIISRHQQLAKRKQAEQALRETNERLTKVLEIETVGVMFWDLATGCMVDANDTFLKMMGYSRAEVEARCLTWEKLTPLEYHDISRAEISKFMSTGRVGPYEKEYFHKDGTRRWLLFAGSSLGDNQCVEFCVDISERKQIEKALRDSEERFRTLADNISQLAWMTDSEGWIFWYNRRWFEYTGTTLEQMQGWGWASVHHPEHVERVKGRWKDHLKRGDAWEDTFPLRGADGKFRWFLSRAVPIRNDSGSIVRWFGTNTDVTELREAQAQLADRAGQMEQLVNERTASLREAVEQMEEFSYSVSHDLRGPLRAMNAYAGVLLEEYGNRLDETGRSYLEKIRRSSERMNRLTQDVLAYSRVARSQVQLEVINFESLVWDVIHQHANLQPPAAEIEVIRPLPAVLGHETTLGQCVSNLLNNAVKFVAPGVTPAVRIHAQRSGKHVRVWFEDNGIGIKPEHQQRIFKMFERVHPEGLYEGTGIGLTIVRKAIEKMSGKVGVESDGHKGSRFWIELRSAE